MRFFTILLAVFLFLSCNRPPETPVKTKTGGEQISEEQYRKELEEIKKSLKGDIKIKLKKDGKGSYSWEIAGKDPQEVLKANDILARRLKD